MINDLEQEEELKHTAEEISKIIDDNNNYNSKVAYVVGDVSEGQTAVALTEETVRRFGRIDVLINNAAISEKAYYRFLLSLMYYDSSVLKKQLKIMEL